MIEALLLGLFGSLHCTVMCGPLAVAGCRTRREGGGYVVGRLMMHLLAGATLGTAGHLLPNHAMSQSVLLYLLALGLFIYGLSLLWPRPELVQIGRTRRRPLFKTVATLLPKRGLGLGLVTGLLPCGLLMSAWILAAATLDPLQGALAMGAFSIASLPGLLAPVLLGRFVPRLTPRVRGLAYCALALWIGLRPLLFGGHC